MIYQNFFTFYSGDAELKLFINVFVVFYAVNQIQTSIKLAINLLFPLTFSDKELKLQLDGGRLILSSLKSTDFEPKQEEETVRSQILAEPWMNALVASRVVYLNSLPVSQRWAHLLRKYLQWASFMYN